MKIDTNKILLTGGCSYSQSNRKYYRSKPIPVIPVWCDNLSQWYNMKLVNLGESGAGNSFIAQKINEYIIINREKIGLVAILWTGWDRISFYNHRDLRIIPSSSITIADAPYNIRSINFLDLLHTFPCFDSSVIESIVASNIMAFNSVETLCKLYDIPYVFMQGVAPIWKKFPFWDIYNILEAILANEHLIDESKFIGWPPEKKLGGFNYWDIRDRYTKKHEEWHLVPGFDGHPNETAHEYIAKYFYTGIKKIYEN